MGAMGIRWPQNAQGFLFIFFNRNKSKGKIMIFTIGYDGKGFTTNDLCKILDDANAVLVDVRITPFSRMKGWGSKQLVEAVGSDRYIQRKDLGGGTTAKEKEAGLQWLSDNYYSHDKPNAILMCKEENPLDCHRHHEITGGENLELNNFPEALHIFRSEIFREIDLDKFADGTTKNLITVGETSYISDLVDYIKNNYDEYLIRANNPTA